MPNHRSGHIPGLSRSDLSHPFFGVLKLTDVDATAREIRFRQFADYLTQREKQNVKQQVEATRHVPIPSKT
jgi:predicted nucleotide-binding protein (sugar kinase/HSP70/actin superfamily)